MHDFQAIISSLPELSHDEMLTLRDALDNQLQSETSLPDLSAEAWAEEFRRWAESHRRLPQEADDRRESIYEGRGEADLIRGEPS